MGLVHDDQVPVRVAHALAYLVVAGDEVDGADGLRGFLPNIASIGRVHRRAVDDIEGLTELLVHLAPPLVGQVGGRDDQDVFGESTELEFLDEQTAHYSLARTGVVGDQVSEARLRQQAVVYRVQLMRQRVDLRNADGEVRVVLVCESDAVGFCGEAEVPGVTRQRGHPAAGLDCDGRLEVLDLEELLPSLLGVDALGDDLDALAPCLGGQHPHRLRKERTFEDCSLAQSCCDFDRCHRRPYILDLDPTEMWNQAAPKQDAEARLSRLEPRESGS